MPVRTSHLMLLVGLPLLSAAVIFGCSPAATAQSNKAGQKREGESELDSLVEFSAFPDTDRIEAGDTFSLVFHARMKPEWHIYWENPGETGMETQISVDAPEGFDVGSIRWPRPITFKTGGMTTYGYGKETVLFVPVTAPDPLPEAPYTFTAQVTSLACRKKCVMQNQEVTVTVPANPAPLDEKRKKLVKRYRKAVPETFSSLDGSRVRWENGDVVFEGARNGREGVTFYPISVSGVQLGSPSVSLEASGFSLRIPVEWNPDNYLGEQEPAVKGVIALGDDPFGPSYRVSVPLDGRKN